MKNDNSESKTILFGINQLKAQAIYDLHIAVLSKNPLNLINDALKDENNFIKDSQTIKDTYTMEKLIKTDYYEYGYAPIILKIGTTLKSYLLYRFNIANEALIITNEKCKTILKPYNILANAAYNKQSNSKDIVKHLKTLKEVLEKYAILIDLQ